MSKLILASQSQQRKLLMEALGLPFSIKPAHIDESKINEPDLVKRAQLVAQKKAKVVAEQHPKGLVIAADTYAVLEGKELEKPQDQAQAATMLSQLSNQWFKAVTGFCFIDPCQSQAIGTRITQVKFRSLTSQEIRQYIQNNPVTTWSAAFAPTYPAGAALIEQIKGSFTGFTYGLPIEDLMPFLKKNLG